LAVATYNGSLAFHENNVPFHLMLQTVREDADLQKLRESPDFAAIINKYDEPFINENAVKALKNVFGFLKR
jgi:hypothetical protein